MQLPLPMKSLKTRIVVSVYIVLAGSLWALTLVSGHYLQNDLERLLSRQQEASVGYIANEIELQVKERFDALKLVGGEIQPGLLTRPLDLQQFLEKRFVLHQIFNGGVLVTDVEGVVIASTPKNLSRTGHRLKDRDQIASALNGEYAIGTPVIGRLLKAPLIGLAIPIRDPSGKVVGAFAGITDLSQPNFLQGIAQHRVGDTGGHMIVDWKRRLIVTASDAQRVMQRSPPPGANPPLDRFYEGYEGSQVYVNALGTEVLASVKRISGTPWYATTYVGTNEAFAPIESLKKRLYGMALLVTLLAGALTWWIARRQLYPAFATTQLVAEMADGQRPMQRLPVAAQDEIGQLIGSFNKLLGILESKEMLLRLSEERHRVAFQATQDFINITAADDGRYIDVNQGFLDATGYRREEVIGRTSIELGIWDDPEDRRKMVEALSTTGACQNLEARYRKKDGTTAWGLVSAAPATIGGKACIVTITRDITERKRVDSIIRESEHRFRIVSELASDLIYSSIRETPDRFRIDWVIGDTYTLLGLTTAELLELGCWRTIVHPEDIPTHLETTHGLEQGASSSIVLRMLHRDGRIRYFRRQARMEHDGNRLYCAIKDVTEERRGALALAESEAHYRSIFEASQDLVAAIRLEDSVFVEANATYLDALGYTRAEVIGRASPELHIWEDPDERERFIGSIRQERQCWNREIRYRTKDGRLIWGLLTASIIDLQGVECILSVTRDITALKESHRELERYRATLEEMVTERTQALTEANRAAEAASMAKSMFLANMSHEIRTPMNAIVGLTYLMRRSDLSAEQEERAEQIETAANHLLEVINDILDISKIEAGKLTLEENRLAIDTILSGIESMVADRLRAKNLTMSIESDAFAGNLHGDATRIRQALLNYVSNAIKFTSSGVIHLRAIKLSDTKDSTLVRFEVRDAGVGIAPDALPRLFSAFEQADGSTTRKYGGTGLGLAITKRLAVMMGGDVGVESVQGQGALFWFSVLLKKKASVLATGYREADEAAENILSDEYSGTRVLLVDDELVNLEIARSLLEDTGLVVDTATDGELALDLVSRAPYALILMDMRMPRLDGIEATKRIRALPQYACVPIVALTANAFVGDQQACREAGMSDFLGKPYSPEVFFATVLRALRSSPDGCSRQH